MAREDTAGPGRATGPGTLWVWAEVCFVPNWVGYHNNGPEYRFLAVREPLAQRPLPELDAQLTLPFPTITLQEQRYKLHGVVTNRLTLPGEAVIWWYRERCGKGEELHKLLKEDLAGGVLPSGQFGANAAWWAITVLAVNLHLALQQLALGPHWLGKRLKAVRVALLGLPGRVVCHARRLFVRLSPGHPALALLLWAHGARSRRCRAARPPKPAATPSAHPLQQRISAGPPWTGPAERCASPSGYPRPGAPPPRQDEPHDASRHPLLPR